MPDIIKVFMGRNEKFAAKLSNQTTFLYKHKAYRRKFKRWVNFTSFCFRFRDEARVWACVWWGVVTASHVPGAWCPGPAALSYRYQEPGPGDVLQASVRARISNSKHITSVLIIITRNLITVSENGAPRTDQSVSPASPFSDKRGRDMWGSLWN